MGAGRAHYVEVSLSINDHTFTSQVPIAEYALKFGGMSVVTSGSATYVDQTVSFEDIDSYPELVVDWEADPHGQTLRLKEKKG